MRLLLVGLCIITLASMVTMSMKPPDDVVLWSNELKKVGDHEFSLTFTANIAKDWHIYSQVQEPDCICTPTEIWTEFGQRVDGNIKWNKGRLSGTMEEKGNRKESVDSIAGVTYYYEDKAIFTGKFRTREDSVRLKVSIKYQTCTGDKCLPPTWYKKVIWLVN